MATSHEWLGESFQTLQISAERVAKDNDSTLMTLNHSRAFTVLTLGDELIECVIERAV